MIKNILEYNNVEIKLDSDLKISDLSLTINQGEFIFLIGKTGSGKSSILKSMYSENKTIIANFKTPNFSVHNILMTGKIGISRSRVIGIINNSNFTIAIPQIICIRLVFPSI